MREATEVLHTALACSKSQTPATYGLSFIDPRERALREASRYGSPWPLLRAEEVLAASEDGRLSDMAARTAAIACSDDEDAMGDAVMLDLVTSCGGRVGVGLTTSLTVSVNVRVSHRGLDAHDARALAACLDTLADALDQALAA